MRQGRLIALTGYATSGKSELSKIWRANHWGYSPRSFAGPLKEEAAPILKLMGLDPSTPEGKAACRPFYVFLGELRRAENPLHWINKVSGSIDERDDVIIDDLRYPNEGLWVLARGGIIVEVKRPGVKAPNATEWESISQLRSICGKEIFEIDNDGTPEEAYAKLRTAHDWKWSK